MVQNVPSDDTLDGLLKIIESELLLQDSIKQIKLNLRVAKDNNNVFYYDLTTPAWELIKVTTNGWEVVQNDDEPLFKRYEDIAFLKYIHQKNLAIRMKSLLRNS